MLRYALALALGVAFVLPSAAAAWRWAEARIDGRHAAEEKARAAAGRYRLEHGHWPRTLGELVPGYLPTIPSGLVLILEGK